MIDGCDREIEARGLCHSCYQVALRKVKEGVVSWENLVDMGLALKTEATKRSPFSKALDVKRAATCPVHGTKSQLPSALKGPYLNHQ